MKTIEKKDPYLNILNTEGNIYEEFLPDQVLTHKNLNKVVNYFEDQDRLSRIYLIGVGIGCGMDIVSYSDGKIIIAQGAGITTDGDIIKTETRTFQYYTELTDRADYALFEGRKIYEMYEQEGAGLGLRADEHPLTSFNTNETGTLKDYIVIAYVENYTEDEGLCGGSGCDETGNKVYSNIKFLLTHKNNYNHLISGDTIYKSHDVLKYYDALPEVCMPRILLTKTNTTSGISIHDQFKNSFFLKTELFTGITKIIDSFKHRINFARYGVNISQITTYFDTIFNVQQEQFIQYKYDLLKDLVDTYREIRELVLHTRFECVPNVNAFPKHLLLGTLEEQTRLEKRHSFYPSPTVSKNDENLLSIRALCIKFFNQLKEYKIPNVSTAAIKVTPSKSYEFKLSERSIPYYYETKNALITNWNPISIQQRKPKNQLGYHVSNLKNIPCIQEPLRYSHLDKNFYRIEGHIGKDFRLALRRINNLKATYNLAFDVKAISIGFPVNQITLDDDICDTKDYAVLLKTWEQEFNCTAESATEFFQKYQFDALGDNDTSTSVYKFATAQLKQNLELLKKQKPEGTKLDKIESKAINTNASGENVKAAARYESSIQYAIDQAYIYAGTQNVSSVFLAGAALGIIDETLGTVDRDSDYFFYTESAVKIVTGLSEIKRNFIQSLDEIYNTEKWTALNNSIDQLCTDIDQVLFAISGAGEGSNFGGQTHDKMYEYFIYDLSKICCLKGKFSWLKEQIDAIRYDIYRELVLSRLIEAHPGIEHMAGVPKGGTFLMVYLGGTESLLDDGRRIRNQFNGVVQFDFALPYMCCSDCPPETVVYNNAKAEATLTIAKTKYCLPDDEAQVDFVIGPTDGIVTSPQTSNTTAFIVETDTGYAFDPFGVSDELLGETLTFLVNGDTPTVPVEICVYRLPQDSIASAEFVEWTAEGIVLNLVVNHEFEDKTYLTHTWKRGETEIATGREVIGILIPNPGTTFNETFTVEIGIIDNITPCKTTAEDSVDETRPPVIIENFPRGLCFPESFVLENVESADEVTTSLDYTIIDDTSGNVRIESGLVQDSDIGEPIEIFINGASAITRVYKVPSRENIRPNEDFVRWEGDDVIVNLTASPIVPNVTHPESYLEVKWFENADDSIPIPNENLAQYAIPSDAGNATKTLFVKVCVKSNLGVITECESITSITIEHIRPTLFLEAGYCNLDSGVFIPIPTKFWLISSEGAEFLTPVLETHYQFEPSLVPDDKIGQRLGFEIGGVEIASTFVYKIPETNSITANYENIGWSGNNLTIKLTATYELLGVNNPESYLKFEWKDGAGNTINNPENHSINSAGEDVNVTYTLTVSVDPTLIGNTFLCETSPIDVRVEEEFPTPEPTLPPNLNLIDKDCWKKGTPNLIYTISVSPNDFAITCPKAPDTLIPNTGLGNYTFNAYDIPDEESGKEIQFISEGSIVAKTTIYKMPADDSVKHDTLNSLLRGNEYFFRFTHDFGQKNYMKYEVRTIPGDNLLTPRTLDPLTFLVTANNEPRALSCKVIITNIDLSACKTTQTVIINVPGREPTIPILTEPNEPTDSGPIIPIIDPVVDPVDTVGTTTNPTNPPSPVGRMEDLVCETQYADRLDILEVGNDFNTLKDLFRGKDYENGIEANVETTYDDVIARMQGSQNIKNDTIASIEDLNASRRKIKEMLLDDSAHSADKKMFLKLDEILELMSLELLRCVDNDTANLLITSITNISIDRNADYEDGDTRVRIKGDYLATFETSSQEVVNELSTAFITRNR